MHDLGQVIAVYSISALQLDLGRGVAHQAAHEVENLAACREEIPVQLRDRRYGGLVYVRDEPGATHGRLVLAGSGRAVLLWSAVGSTAGATL